MTLYIIGGASRSGKTQTAIEMLKMHNIAYFSLDFLTNAVHNGFPKIGVRHEQSASIRAKGLWPGVKAMMKALVEDEVTYLIEGEALMPSDVAAFIKDHERYDICACFLGYPNVDVTKKTAATRSLKGDAADWSDSLDDNALIEHIESGIEFSHFLRNECKKYDLRYFDTSKNFKLEINNVVQFLKAPI